MATEDADGTDAGGAPLLLGTAGAHFRFAVDTPGGAPRWCSAVATSGAVEEGEAADGEGEAAAAGTQADAVRVAEIEAFLVDVVQGRA